MIKILQNNYKVFAMLLVMICLQVLWSEQVFAGTTDTTLSPILDKLTGWLNGDFGKIIAVTALFFAIIGCIIKFNPALLGGAIGIALVASFGPEVIKGLITAII